MTRSILRPFLFGFLSIGALAAQGQDPGMYCTYFGDNVSDDILRGRFSDYGLSFDSNEEAIACVDRIIERSGLARNFVVQRDDDQANACALIHKGRRYIIYNNDFMELASDLATNDWGAISILAHEVGHHLNGHLLDASTDRPDLELEADRYSGYVLYMMGASLQDAQAAMSQLVSEQDSPTHPGKFKRLKAIQDGWTKASRAYPRQERKEEPNPMGFMATYTAHFEHTAEMLSAEEKRMAGGNTHRINLYIDAPAEELERVESVTYHLHPTFPNPDITVVDPVQGFLLSLTAWGTFQASATVRYKDGTSRKLEHYLSF